LADFGMKDQLTGIPNRRSFDNRMDLEWKRSTREKKPLSVMIIDVDKFKNYNDTFGHQQGDVALQTVASTVKKSLSRSTDFAARWGGEEFVILLPTTDATGAGLVAEKVRREIEKAVVPCDNAKGEKITVSVGVSTQTPAPGLTIGSFISIADEALYKAKETGRNRVVLGGEPQAN
jgi:diguanylate cyclase (GGDEF)-like protein